MNLANPLRPVAIILLVLAQLPTGVSSKALGSPLDYQWRITTVDYAIRSSCQQRGWHPEIDKAARVWNNAGSPFRLNRNDGQYANEWYCADRGPDNDRNAITDYGPLDAQGFLTMVWTIINTYYPYGVGEPGKYDVWNVSAHEFGHWLALDHTGYVDATMYGGAGLGETKKRILFQTDIDGIRALYGWDGIWNWDFNVTGDREGWTPVNFAWTNGVAYDAGADSGAWIGGPNNDPQFLSQVYYNTIDASTYRYLVVRMADQNAISNRWFQLYWDNGSGFSPALHTDFDFWQHQNNPEGGPNIWATYSIDLYNRHSGWRGNVRQVRFEERITNDMDREFKSPVSTQKHLVRMRLTWNWRLACEVLG